MILLSVREYLALPDAIVENPNITRTQYYHDEFIVRYGPEGRYPT